ncbi:hypothetical protein BDB00DRAFT_755563 [Zychaea mexicana]|uniref:uncharacterized protein n=1 Tax=Zychaea mexicana TaxID=64656 RepID=UPI0022FDDCE3|nr:uncharacterized protein BDB00DRAFT_755563 [Zychaea mexicana]KAI9498067.1 hypothetical protein BDB00DRAFT_755563 [Zychaea mexicana]
MSAQQSFCELEIPRITSKTIQTLASIATIIAPYNQLLPEDLLEELWQDKAEHAELQMLKQFPTTHIMLIEAIDQPLEQLLQWLWTYDSKKALGTEKQLLQAIRCILTDFASNCINPWKAPFSDSSERAFLINHVAPIFKSFGNHTDLLCFNWCETYLRQQTQQARVMVSTGQFDKAILRFVDGLGYDKNNDERLVLEASGGHASDSHQHAIDDTLKIVHSLMCILKGDARKHINGSLCTYRKVKAFGVQTVKSSLILSEMSLGEDLKYKYKEVRTAEIPINDDHRSKFFPIVDLLAYLMVQLDLQMKHLSGLQEEHDGKVVVKREDTIRSTLYNT